MSQADFRLADAKLKTVAQDTLSSYSSTISLKKTLPDSLFSFWQQCWSFAKTEFKRYASNYLKTGEQTKLELAY